MPYVVGSIFHRASLSIKFAEVLVLCVAGIRDLLLQLRYPIIDDVALDGHDYSEPGFELFHPYLMLLTLLLPDQLLFEKARKDNEIVPPRGTRRFLITVMNVAMSVWVLVRYGINK